MQWVLAKMMKRRNVFFMFEITYAIKLNKKQNVIKMVFHNPYLRGSYFKEVETANHLT